MRRVRRLEATLSDNFDIQTSWPQQEKNLYLEVLVVFYCSPYCTHQPKALYLHRLKASSPEWRCISFCGQVVVGTANLW